MSNVCASCGRMCALVAFYGSVGILTFYVWKDCNCIPSGRWTVIRFAAMFIFVTNALANKKCAVPPKSATTWSPVMRILHFFMLSHIVLCCSSNMLKIFCLVASGMPVGHMLSFASGMTVWQLFSLCCASFYFLLCCQFRFCL